MAKPPSKRRGITLGVRADSTAALELLNVQPANSVTPEANGTHSSPETAGGDPGVTPTMMKEQFAQLCGINADLGVHWRRQSEQIQEQLQRLEQQREEIAQQTRQLQALKQNQQRSHRLGVLLSMLALAGVAALGFHTWPRLQDVAGDWSRVSTGVVQLAPQVQTIGGQVTSMTSDIGQIGSAMTTLRKDVSDLRSDLGSLRKVVHTLPENKPAAQAAAGSTRRAAYTLPRNATTIAHPYWAMRRMTPW